MSAQIHTYADENYSLELVIDWENGDISISERHESQNAITFHRYHGHEDAYGLPDAITVSDWEALNEELQPLVERVVAGYESCWDGNNHVARFDDDATAARDEIETLIDGYRWDEVEVWDAGEWVDAIKTGYDIDGDRGGDVVRYVLDTHTITWETTDAELSAMDDDLSADDGRGAIVRGMYDYLYELREECIKNYQAVEREIVEAIEEDEDAPKPARLHTVRLATPKPKSARESAEAMVEAFSHLPLIATEPVRLYSFSELHAAMQRAYEQGNPNLRISKRTGDVIFTECCWPRWMGDYWVGVSDLRLDPENITAARWQLDHAGVKY
jgi:hypothetical protein